MSLSPLRTKPFSLSPRGSVPQGSAAHASAPRGPLLGLTCPMGADCSCVFSANMPTGFQSVELDEALIDGGANSAAVAAEVKHWTDRGWRTVRADTQEVVLERPRSLGFCVNVLLSIATGLVWLAYWIPNSRHPRVDITTITVSQSGDVVTTRELARR